MGIGGSIFLIAVGAIIAFGINVHPGALNLYAIGWILMLVGIFGLALTLWVWNTRRRRVITRRRIVEPAPQAYVDPTPRTYAAPTYTEPPRAATPTVEGPTPPAYPAGQSAPAEETYVEERSTGGSPRPY